MNGNSSKLSCRRTRIIFFVFLNLVFQSKLETRFQISLLLVTATERLSTRSGFGQAASFSPCPALDIGAAGQCPDLGIRPTDPHFVRERSVVENRLQKTAPKKCQEKSGRCKKCHKSPNLWRLVGKKCPCAFSWLPALKAGISVEGRVLWSCSRLALKESAMLSFLVHCISPQLSKWHFSLHFRT